MTQSNLVLAHLVLTTLTLAACDDAGLPATDAASSGDDIAGKDALPQAQIVPGNAPGVVGFASLDRSGRLGTNGGAGGAVVSVRDYAALVGALADDTARVVQITGTIRGPGPMVRVGSNKTILGVGATATIDGFGFNVSGFGDDEALGDACDAAEKNAFGAVENVIVRNLSFRNSADDSINVQCYSHHIWIDHNTFYASHDGSVDVKRGADWITVSWNRFAGTDKSMLLGHSDDNGAQDRGFLHATYHHNWFDHSNTRHPRVRFGQAHVYNNYANGITDYFVGAGVECDLTAEANYTDAIKRLVTYWDGVKVTWASSNLQATPPHAKDGLVQNGRGFNPRSYYAYTLDAAASIPTLVSRGAGVGRI